MSTRKVHLDYYDTNLGSEFTFAFQFDGENYVIHILNQPDYGDQSDDGHATHRVETHFGCAVCWTGPIPTLAEAKRIAALWADYTERYILEGEPFPEGGE